MYIHVYMYTLYVQGYICTHTRIHVHVYMYMYIHVYMYTLYVQGYMCIRVTMNSSFCYSNIFV